MSFVSFEVHGVAVNQFTLPAFLSAVLSIIGLVGLVLFFRYLYALANRVREVH